MKVSELLRKLRIAYDAYGDLEITDEYYKDVYVNIVQDSYFDEGCVLVVSGDDIASN